MRSALRGSLAIAGLCWLMSLALLVSPAAGGIVIPIDDDELIRGADVIAQGSVTRIESHQDRFGQIHTYITFRLDEVFKGDVRGRQLTIREIGGTVGDRSYWVFANPEFVVGERVLMFMSQRADGTLRSYQLYLGKFSILTDPASGALEAVRGVPRRVTVIPNAVSRSAPVGAVARLFEDLKRRIREKANDPPPPTLRPHPAMPMLSAVLPSTGTTEDHQEFRFLGDPNPPAVPNPNATLRRWFEADSNQPVVMRINSSGEPTAPTLGFQQIRAALKAWSRVPTSSFRFAEGPTTTAVGFQGGDGVNAISFRDPLGQFDDPVNCGGILAAAGISLSTSSQTTTVNGRTFNRALAGDVVVNNGWESCGIFYQNFANFTEVMTHELGHVLGLGHSQVSSVDPLSGIDGATMEPIAHFDGRGAALHADDQAGVTFIYPGVTLTIRKDGLGGGRITSGTDGIECGAECTAGFAPNSSVTLTATPDPGSFFGGFAEAGCGTTVVMSADRTCTALFTTSPDLTISAISITGPAVAAPGSTIMLNNTVRNSGMDAGPFNVGFYLSNSSTVTTLDRPLGTPRRVTGGLAANATSSDVTSLLIPADVAPGTYVVGAIADVDNEVAEVVGGGESNNAAAVAIVIAKPDLVVTSLTAPVTAGAGLSVTLNSTVKNQATAAVSAPSSTLGFYLSADGGLGGAVRLVETRAIPKLAKDATSVGPTTVTIPASTPAGAYMIIAVADDLEVVDESNENNNTRATATTIAVSRPDLAVTSVTVTPTLTAENLGVNVTHVVRNVAPPPATAPASTSRLTLSANTTLGDADDIDLGPVSIAALAGGAQVSVSTTVRIPSGTAPGQYWMFARANDGDAIPEANTVNNAGRTTQPITVGPDLLVSAATLTPASTAPGMTVKVTSTVKNQGGPTPTSFDVGIYLSDNATYEAGTTQLLATRRVIGGLAAGRISGPIVTPVVIPADTSPKAHFLIVRADAGGAQPNGDVSEASESNNNLATTAIQVVRPDLTVLSVTAPATARAGTNVSVTHVVKNVAVVAGGAPISTSRLYLSTGPALDRPGDVVLGDAMVAALAGGAQATVTTTVSIPPGTPSGLYWIIAEANATKTVQESDAPTLTNNVKATLRPVIIGADLVVTAASPTPVATAPGRTVNVLNAVKNQGGAPAGAFDVGVYLSASTAFDVTAQLLATRRVSSGLAPGLASLATTPVVVPGDQPAGTRFLIVRADMAGGAPHEVDEANESNNTLATVAIQIVRADLTVLSVTAPATAKAGTSMSVTHVVKNLAPAAGVAPGSTTRFFLSPDQVLDVASDVVLGEVPIGALAGGAMAAVPASLHIPLGTAPGRYWVIAQANVNGTVQELDSPLLANNVKATATPVLIGPDLIVTTMTATPASVAPGFKVSVVNTVRNQGLVPAGAFDIGIYVSPNGTLDGGDQLLATRRVAAGLAPGQTSAATTTVTLPSNQSGGTYVLIGRADVGGSQPDGEVIEGNETNNELASAPIQVVRPDLAVQSVSATPGVARAGTSVRVTHVVRNLAAAGGTAGPTTTRLFLSTAPSPPLGAATLPPEGDASFSFVDAAVPSIPGGGTATVTTPFTLPLVGPGRYWVVARANALGAIFESDAPGQANNVGVTANPVLIGPDLVVTAATASPAAIAPGFIVSVTNTIRNQGGEPSPAFDVGIYLSTDALLDAGDTLLTTRRVAGLAPAASSPATTTVTIPRDAAAGTYFLIVRADSAVPQEVAEADEANNARPTGSIQVVRPDLMMLPPIATPGAMALTGSVSVTLRVRNIAPLAGRAAGTTARLYLSDVPSPVGVTSQPVLGDVPVPSFAGGATVAVPAKSFPLPSGTVPGRYWIYALANAVDPIEEGGLPQQSNNLERTAAPIVVGPDLTPTSMTAPALASPNFTLPVATTVKNQGGQASTASVVRFFLSVSGALDGTEIPLGVTSTAGLAPGASITTTAHLTLPDDTSAGAKFLLARADGDDQIVEADETNNVIAKRFNVQLADLKISTFTAPAVVIRGRVTGAPTASIAVKNQGPGPAAPFSVQVLAGRDDGAPGSGDLLFTRSVAALAPGATTTVSGPIVVPDTVGSDVRLAGNYLVSARAVPIGSATSDPSLGDNTVVKMLAVLPDMTRLRHATVPLRLSPACGVTSLELQGPVSITSQSGTNPSTFSGTVTLDDPAAPFHAVYTVRGTVSALGAGGPGEILSTFTYVGGGTSGNGTIKGSAPGLDFTGGVILGQQTSPASACAFSGTIDIVR